MRKNYCSIMTDKLIERLSSLNVEGDVIDKNAFSEGKITRRCLVIKFKDREIEKDVGKEEFDRTQVGDKVQFTPPVPECAPCRCHVAICMITGLVIGCLAIAAITSHFSGRIAVMVSLIVAAWISVLIACFTSCHEDNKHLTDLQKELRFFTEEGRGKLGN